jgi:phosphatidylinositol glycan class B
MRLKNPAFRWPLILLVTQLIAVVLQNGYGHCDEHFQVLEFAGLKLGFTHAELLPWEFGARIRPWLQPWLYANLWRVVQGVFRVENTLHLVFVARLVTALAAWAVTCWTTMTIANGMRSRLKRNTLWLLVCSYWFLPYLGARTSSENLGAIFFYSALALFLSSKSLELSPRRALLLGVLGALSFNARYQMALMVGGLFAWLLTHGTKRLRTVACITAGLLIAETACLLIDWWGYGSWQWVPWSYFKVNVLEHKANDFGTSPWWTYFAESVMNDGIGGLLLMVSMLVFWVRRAEHVLTWCTAPFFAVHLLLAHKESRFLFPLVLAQLLMATLLIPDNVLFLCARKWRAVSIRRVAVLLTGAILITNAGALVLSTLNVHSSQMTALNALWLHPDEPLYFFGTNPYQACSPLKMQTLEPPDKKLVAVSQLVSQAAYAPINKPESWGVIRHGWERLGADTGCQLEYHSTELVLDLEQLVGRELPSLRERWSSLEVYTIYRCQRTPVAVMKSAH